MRQPVVDTLRLSDTLRKAGMEREQAEGVARGLGKELGEHVAVQSDLDAGFRGVRSEMGLTRSGLEAGIEGVRSEMGLMRSELEARIEGVRSEMGLMRSELEARIEGVRSEMGLMRSELEARIEGVRSEMGLMRSELEARIEGVRSELEARIEGVRSDLKALNSKFNFGFGLLAALLATVIGILLGPTGRTGATMPTPPIMMNFPATTAIAPTAVPVPPAAPTDSTAAQDRDTASIASDPDSAGPR